MPPSNHVDEASSENIREQAGHCDLSPACLPQQPAVAYRSYFHK